MSRQAVRAIIADVAARGDAALIELSRKFDRVDLERARLARPAPRSRPPPQSLLPGGAGRA